MKLFTQVIVFATFYFNTHAQTVNDYDGNSYDVITIGTQKWLKQNLVTSHFSNGDIIPNVTDGVAWSTLTASGMCFYNNDSVMFADAFGAIYNGYVAISTTRNVCPLEWHVATDSDWKILEKFVDASVDTTLEGSYTGSTVGRHLREIFPGTWTPSSNSFNYGIDTYGFSATAAGVRSSTDGSYGGMGNYADFWTSTNLGITGGYVHYLYFDNSQVQRVPRNVNNGYSIRCVQDADASLEKTYLDDLNLFPNPANNGVFTIDAADISENVSYTVTNLSGEIILQNEILNGTKVDIDLSKESKGMYMIHLATDSAVKTERIVVQ